MAFLHVKGLNFIYAGDNTPALVNANLEVQRGEFLLLCGPSGCGKTTLLHHLKPFLEPKGDRQGEVFLNDVNLNALSQKEAASKIGLIMQNPESQIVTETVRHELAFGLECLGLESAVIAKRIAETISYFGIEGLYNKKTDELSGGEKQLVSIAAVMAMRPELLLLDEPASQLDPVAARSLYDILLRINNELGITVIISEHRIDDIFSIAGKVAVMNEGKLVCVGSPGIAAAFMAESGDERIHAMLPVPARLYKDIYSLIEDCKAAEKDTIREGLSGTAIPVTVREVKPWFEASAEKYLTGGLTVTEAKSDDKHQKHIPLIHEKSNAVPVINLKTVSFRFDKLSEDVIKNLSLTVNKGEIMCIVGGNGAGKTTLLRLISGIIKPYSGKRLLLEPGLKMAYLPQNPQSMFAFDSVLEDLLNAAGEISSTKRFIYSTGLAGSNFKIPPKLQSIIDKLGINEIIEKHPFDLSFGELQRAALAMLLLKSPDVLLLDEPTKGIDAFAKKKTADLLKSLCADGMTVVAVTHDIEFAAEYSDRSAMLFDGSILNTEPPEEFFSGNMCYTTIAHRIAGNVFTKTVTCEEVKSKWKEFAIKG